jgi:HK97 family phage major capsid protein
MNEKDLSNISKMKPKDIEARLATISGDIEKRGAEMGSDELDAYEKEAAALMEARKAAVQTQEKRAGMLKAIADDAAAAKVVRSFAPDDASGELIKNSLGTSVRSAAADRLDTITYRMAFMDYVLRGKKMPIEYRADAITHTTDVGELIPTTVLNRIVEKMESTGMILPLVTRTAYKGGVQIPTSSVKPVATWVAEGAGSDKQKKTTGVITFAYYKLRCAVAVTLEVETMAMSVFENTLISNVVEAMIKGLEQAIVSGTGVGQPEGILSKTPPAGQSLGVAVPSYEDLVQAEAAIPVAYESNTVWCMSKKTFMQYFGLTDTNGQPIARINYGITNRPERSLLGRTVVLTDYLPSYDAALANGTVFAFLFNFKDYTLNTNYAMGLKKYEDNDTDDTVTRAVMLVDGKVVDVNSLVTLKKA